MPHNSAELIAVGNIGRVSVERPDRARTTILGGAAFNIAAGASYSGLKPHLVSIVGTDLSSFELQRLEGVTDVSRIARTPGKTAHFTLSYSSLEREPAIDSAFGVSELLTDHALGCVYAGSWVHVSCREPLESGKLLRHVLKHQIQGLSIDLMFSSLASQIPMITSVVRHAKYIFMNAVEYQELSSLLQELRYPGLTVITEGQDGARVLRGREPVAHVPAVPTERIVETSGAGDVFLGAFLAASLRGCKVVECLSQGVKAGALAVQGAGTIMLENRDEVT